MSNEPKKKSTAQSVPSNLDYVLDVLRYAESSDTSGIRSRGTDEKGNTTYASTAYGYYQITKGTLDDINKSAVSDGLKPLTLNSREEQHEAGRRLVLDYDRYLRNTLNIKNPTLEDYYGVHFKGKAGYKELLSADKSASISKHARADEIAANPNVLKGTVGDVMKTLSSKVEKAKTALKNEPADRKAIIRKEKSGFDTGTFTPVDLRPGKYRGDGKEKWDYNASFPNGKALGQHNMDYVLEVGEGSAKILKKGETKVADIKGSYTVNEYDYTANFYDPSMDAPVASGKGSGKENNYELSEVENYGGNGGFGTKYTPIDEVKNGVAEEVNYQSMNDGEIAKLNATKFKGQNFHTAQGNMGDMYMKEVNGKMVNMDSPEALKASMNSGINYAQEQFVNEMAMAGKRNQFKLGGDMNQPAQGTQQNNEGLVSFDAGGSHEENPLGGIPQNVNPDGTTNTVEEGETKHQDYVFSDSLTILPREAEELMLPEDIEGMTYAEASKFLNKILEENAFDPIIKRTVDKQLDNLKLGNEKARMSYEADELASQDYSEQIANQGQPIPEDPNVLLPEDGQGMVEPDYSSTGPGQVPQPNTQPVQGNGQGFQLDPEMMNPPDKNEMLLGSDAVQSPQFRLGGNMYDDGGLLWGPTAGGEQYKRESLYNAPRENFNLDEAPYADDGATGAGVNALSSAGDKYSGAASGVISGGLGMKEAFSLKDKVAKGEKIDKGAVALKGAAAGATIGGSVGSVVPVIGTAIGAAAGAVIGGASGLIVGNTAAKKSERRHQLLEDQAFSAQVSDFRTGSGIIEGDTKEFNLGGSLTDPPKFDKFEVGNLGSKNYLYNNATFGPGVANLLADNDNVMEPLTIDVNNSTTPQSPVNYSLDESNTTSSVKSASGNSTKEGDGAGKKLLLEGENYLRYAPILGLMEDRNKVRNANFRESYVHSGERFVPREIDENGLISNAMLIGRNTDRLLQANANGSAAAARANVLANSNNVSKSIGDIYQKIIEYNNEQDRQANIINNDILNRRDTIVNAEAVANANNAQSQFELERNADLRLYQALGDLGRERTVMNQSRNATGYDHLGRKINRQYR